MLVKHWFFFSALFISYLASAAAHSAAAIDLSSEIHTAIGHHIEFFAEDVAAEGRAKLPIADAILAFDTNGGQQAKNSVLSFGLGSKPIWLHFDVINSSAESLGRQLSVETAWLDHIDVYIRHQNGVIRHFYGGDAQPYNERLVDSHLFKFDLDFAAGESAVYIRVQTPDNMLLPIFLMTPEQAQRQELRRGYIYGFIYGFVLALVAYNSILFLSLRKRRYLYYVIYLGSFVLANFAYTGHAYDWFWPSSPIWQQYSIPILVILYCVSGLLFAINFLETKQNLPRMHKAVITTISSVILLLILSLLFGSQLSIQWLSFLVVVILFPIMMITLGSLSLYSRVKSARYFLMAAIAAMLGAVTTSLTVLGFVPYSIWAYHAVEIGMLIDAILLALALSDFFRITQEEKIQAEKMAAVDPLTGIYNRRGFYNLVDPIISTASRSNRNISLILLDIDKFKVINDVHGHSQGDNVLTKIATVLDKSARRGDVIARWGGEEFILLLPETSLGEAGFLAERLREAIANISIRNMDREINFTASFGVAHMTEEISSFDELVVAADEQLYRAKDQGRNKVSFAGYELDLNS